MYHKYPIQRTKYFYSLLTGFFFFLLMNLICKIIFSHITALSLNDFSVPLIRVTMLKILSRLWKIRKNCKNRNFYFPTSLSLSILINILILCHIIFFSILCNFILLILKHDSFYVKNKTFSDVFFIEQYKHNN